MYYANQSSVNSAFVSGARIMLSVCFRVLGRCLRRLTIKVLHSPPANPTRNFERFTLRLLPVAVLAIAGAHCRNSHTSDHRSQYAARLRREIVELTRFVV